MCKLYCKQFFGDGCFERSNQSFDQRILMKRRLSPQDWVLIIACLLCQSIPVLACTHIGRDLSDYDCLEYDADQSVFELRCPFAWTDNTKCIVLNKNERLEGNGYFIDLNGVSNWEGLVRTAPSDNRGPSSLEDAPVINNVHTMGGESSHRGGFIIQSGQKHFIVKNCSSSGVIQGHRCSPCLGGGGICGMLCSGDILITRCWSSGEIRGYTAGGIAGRHFGSKGDDESNAGTATISHCYSTGDIVGAGSSGICGNTAGWGNTATITIKQCYSLGKICDYASGGITGTATGSHNGHAFITNCYSRGDITEYAGGICGTNTGQSAGTVILTNVYSSGKMLHSGAGGLIAHIRNDAHLTRITMSVYNGDMGSMIRVNDAVGG